MLTIISGLLLQDTIQLMLLVILGAGASFDSVPHVPPTQIFSAHRPEFQTTHFENFRPPLANQLFDTRPLFVGVMQDFPHCKEVIPLLRKSDIIVERELAILREQAKTFPRGLQELIAIQFYIQMAIRECTKQWENVHRGITNYATFLRELERLRLQTGENICLVTFNYDTMLESAMIQVLGFEFPRLQSYIASRNYVVIKLHGSDNWIREIDNERLTHPIQLIKAAERGLIVSDRYRIMHEQPIYDNGSVGLPALSIPVERKDEFSCPETHVRTLTQILPKVTKIITIGWRGTETEFLQMLQEHLPVGAQDLLVVSGDERGAHETIENLRVKNHAVQPWAETTATHGFTGLINNLGVLESCLRRTRSSPT